LPSSSRAKVLPSCTAERSSHLRQLRDMERKALTDSERKQATVARGKLARLARSRSSSQRDSQRGSQNAHNVASGRIYVHRGRREEERRLKRRLERWKVKRGKEEKLRGEEGGRPCAGRASAWSARAKERVKRDAQARPHQASCALSPPTEVSCESEQASQPRRSTASAAAKCGSAPRARSTRA